MSFTGNLEDLAIVDVIQLLHTTRKSGTLCVKGTKGEGQLVFQDGLIISAKHPDSSLRTGDYLVAMNFISQEVLAQALETQKNSGKPLIATLVEQGKIKKDEAFKGLETLVDMTVVEMVRWTKGSFTLDVDAIAVDDEFSYFPDNLVLDTQMVLMDALRIFDEKTRDGEFTDDDSSDAHPEEKATPPHSSMAGNDPAPRASTDALQATAEAASPSGSDDEGADLTLDDLGLGDFDKVEKSIPDVFTALEVFDPSEIHRQVIKKTLPEVTSTQQEELVTFLTQHSAQNQSPSLQQSRALILLSRDELVKHAIMTICKYDQIMVYIVEQEEDLDQAVAQTMKRGLAILIVIDKIETMDEIGLLALQQQKILHHVNVPVLQLASPVDYGFSLQSLKNGVRTILPKPTRASREKTFIDDYLNFLKAFRIYVDRCFSEQTNKAINMLGQYVESIQSLTEARDISYSLLQAVSEIFDRTITLVIKQSELIAERGLGTGLEKDRSMLFKIPLQEGSVFLDVAKSGKPFYGSCEDRALTDHLYSHISAPESPDVLLLPIKNRGRAIALIYGDYGSKQAQPLNLDTLTVLADLASLALENSFYVKQLEKLKS